LADWRAAANGNDNTFTFEAAVFETLVDAALRRRWVFLGLQRCRMQPACVGALARLLTGGGVIVFGQRLVVCGADEPARLLLAGALRGNRTLTSLTLSGNGFFYDIQVFLAVLDAVTGHGSLRNLELCGNSGIIHFYWQNKALHAQYSRLTPRWYSRAGYAGGHKCARTATFGREQ
jgi:hypothetical protein